MNKLKLREEKADYFINGNKVTCNVVFTFNIDHFRNACFFDKKATRIINSNIKSEGNISIKDKCISELRAIFEVRGIAICSSNDTFDENLGKKIAHSRAIIKGYNKYKKILSVSQSSLYDKSVNLYNNIKRVEKIAKREKKHLSNLVNS